MVPYTCIIAEESLRWEQAEENVPVLEFRCGLNVSTTGSWVGTLVSGMVMFMVGPFKRWSIVGGDNTQSFWGN